MKRILLVTAVILGIGAWVVIPNLLIAMDRSRQKRTMADIRAVATAWEARSEITKSYWDFRVSANGKMPAQVRISPSELESVLAPTYIKTLPHTDGWGHEFQFAISDFDESGHAGSYTIRALGSDGRPDRMAARGATTKLTDDIVYSDGAYIQYPEGIS